MKNILFLILIGNFFNLSGQNSAVYNYSITGNKTIFYDIISDHNCGTYVSGFDQTAKKIFILHLNSNSDTLWARSLDFSPYAANIFDIKLSLGDDAIYFLAGKFSILPITNISYFIIGKLDTLGNLQWAKSNESSFYISAGFATNLNEIYCSFASNASDTLKLFKFDSNGNHLWKKAITVPIGFSLPFVSDILFVNYDRVLVVGRLSGYASYAHLGSFCLWLNKQSGYIFPMSRIYTNSPNNKVLSFSNVKINHQLYMCGATLTSGIMISKHNLGSGQSISKQLYNSLENINAKSIHLTDSNHLVITGIVTGLNNKTKGLQIELDTNLTLLSAYKFDEHTNLIDIKFNKSINNCGINRTIGTISENNLNNGYLLSKEFGNDSVCNQETYSIQDSLFADTVSYYTPSEQLTNEWSSISFSQSDLFFHKSNCLTLDNLIEKSFQSEIKIYPNPSNNGIFNIESNETMYAISISNVLGELVYYENNSNSTTQLIETSKFNNGLYFITIHGKSSEITKKIIIEN
jgi:hypothetical protein